MLALHVREGQGRGGGDRRMVTQVEIFDLQPVFQLLDFSQGALYLLIGPLAFQGVAKNVP